MNPIRCPFPRQMFEVTTRTLQGEFLLRPSPEINALVLGVFGHAQEATGMEIHGFAVMSNHYHILLTCRNAEQLSKFMRLLNGGLSKKLNHYHERKGTMWHRRFRAIGVSPDKETQEARMHYILAHGVKEKLVATVEDWPGATSLPWLLRGEKIEGVWTSFTARYNASRRKSYVPIPGEFDTKYEVKMTVMPCWAHLQESQWRELIANMVNSIDAVDGPGDYSPGPILGKRAVLNTSPRSRPKQPKSSCAPAVHAVDFDVRLALTERLKAIAEAYATASRRFRAGDWEVEFPAGTFRPHGRFVPVCEVEDEQFIW